MNNSSNNFFLSYGDETRIMGIVNVTPDSFYDGGFYNHTVAAIKHGESLAREGAHILDIGGESTRPGSDPVSPEMELERVIPVIKGLREKVSTPVSIDTQKAEVARRAIEAGASIINDVSAGEHDPGILRVAAETGVYYIAMHMRGTPKEMQNDTGYDSLIDELKSYFENRLQVLTEAGIQKEKIILDPGIGFGKSLEGNYAILAHLKEFRAMRFPLLAGPSRKSYLSLAGASLPEDRLPGTLAAVTICALAGVEIVRVHDVAPALQAVNVALRVGAVAR